MDRSAYILFIVLVFGGANLYQGTELKRLTKAPQAVTLNAEFTNDHTMYAMSLPSDQGKCEMFVNSKNNLMRCVWVLPHDDGVILCPTTHEVVPDWIEPTDMNIENYCND